MKKAAYSTSMVFVIGFIILLIDKNCVLAFNYTGMDCSDAMHTENDIGARTAVISLSDGIPGDESDPNAQGGIVPEVQSTVEYNDQFMVNISPENINSSYHAIPEGQEMLQGFKLSSPYPLAEEVVLERLIFKIHSWPGETFDIDLTIYEADGTTVVAANKIDSWSEDMAHIYPETGLPSPERSKLITLDSPVTLNINTAYYLGIRVNQADNPFDLYTTLDDYADGDNSMGKDIWFVMQVAATLNQYGLHTVEGSADNQFWFDPGWATPIKAKLLGVGAPEETLIVTKTPDPNLFEYDVVDPNLFEYAVADPNIASLSVTSDGSVDTLRLTGLQEGQTSLSILYNGVLVELVELLAFKPRRIALSYQYIAYPGETDHPLKDAFGGVSEYISLLYAKANIAIDWTNQGIIEYEWDLDGDGDAYEVDYSEFYAILDHNIIPNADQFFSNLYLLRRNKDDDFQRGGDSGSGTSIGFGASDTPPRAALVMVHLFRTPQGIGSTLAHELAHNLGLAHYSSVNYNYYPVSNEFENCMHVGRHSDELFAFQWLVLHRTLEVLAEGGETY